MEKHFERARRTVASWPKWKQRAAEQAFSNIDLGGGRKMREIEFRGLTKEGKWVYGWYFEPYNAGWKSYIVVGHLEHNEITYTPTEVIPETVGQWTGLKDKNGVKIFESDRVDYEVIGNIHESQPLFNRR